MNIMKLFPSKYVKSEDLNGNPITLTMQAVQVELMGQGDKEQKPVLYFKNATKGLVLNKVNATTISHLYTPETDSWVGKRITIYPTQVRAFGKMQSAIRIEDRIPAALEQGQADEAGEAMVDSEDVA